MAETRVATERWPYSAKIRGLYVIQDMTAGKVYLGSSVELPKRLYAHQNALIRGKHSNHRLQRAFNNGHDLRVHPIPVSDGSNVLQLEQVLIDEFIDQGLLYNIAKDTCAPTLGYKHSEETRAKMSSTRKGRQHSPEHIEKIRAPNAARNGRSVMINGVDYPSLSAAARAHNTTVQAMSDRFHKGEFKNGE